MFARPRPLLFIAYLAALGLLVAMIMFPLPEAIWRRLDPLGHSFWQLTQASWFTAPYRNDIAEVETPVPAWRTVARASTADSLFQVLAEQPNSAARLYALAGLTLRNPAAADALRDELLRDSTMISANLSCTEGGERRRVSEVAQLAGSMAFARLLLEGGGECP